MESQVSGPKNLIFTAISTVIEPQPTMITTEFMINQALGKICASQNYLLNFTHFAVIKIAATVLIGLLAVLVLVLWIILILLKVYRQGRAGNSKLVGPNHQTNAFYGSLRMGLWLNQVNVNII